MFDFDTLSPQFLVGILVILALILGIPFALSFRRRLAEQKREELVLAQRRRDEARWHEIQAGGKRGTRKGDQEDDLG